MSRLAAGVCAAALIAWAAAGCGDDGPDDTGIRFSVEATIDLGRDAEPVALAALPDGDVLVGERRTGAIRRITADGDLREPVAQVDVQAGPSDQRGLLGLAVRGDRTYAAWTRAVDGRLAISDGEQVRLLARAVEGDARPQGGGILASR